MNRRSQFCDGRFSLALRMTLALHVEHYGQGRAIVLLHGFGGSARNFRPQARAFSEKHRVTLFDARGHARSPAPADANAYERRCFVADFGDVLDRAQVTSAVVGGLSMGAFVSLQFALAFPERVQALVLSAFPSSGEDPKRRDWALGFADAIEQRGLDAAGAEFVWGEQSRFDPKGAALIRQGFLEHAPHALAHILRSVLAPLPSPRSLEAELTKLTVPTLVIVGSNDHESLAPCRELASLIPNAKLEIIEGAGHVVNLAAPSAFNAALGAFLDSL